MRKQDEKRSSESSSSQDSSPSSSPSPKIDSKVKKPSTSLFGKMRNLVKSSSSDKDRDEEIELLKDSHAQLSLDKDKALKQKDVAVKEKLAVEENMKAKLAGADKEMANLREQLADAQEEKKLLEQKAAANVEELRVQMLDMLKRQKEELETKAAVYVQQLCSELDDAADQQETTNKLVAHMRVQLADTELQRDALRDQLASSLEQMEATGRLMFDYRQRLDQALCDGMKLRAETDGLRSANASLETVKMKRKERAYPLEHHTIATTRYFSMSGGSYKWASKLFGVSDGKGKKRNLQLKLLTVAGVCVVRLHNWASKEMRYTATYELLGVKREPGVAVLQSKWGSHTDVPLMYDHEFKQKTKGLDRLDILFEIATHDVC